MMGTPSTPNEMIERVLRGEIRPPTAEEIIERIRRGEPPFAPVVKEQPFDPRDWRRVAKEYEGEVFYNPASNFASISFPSESAAENYIIWIASLGIRAELPSPYKVRWRRVWKVDFFPL